MTGMSQVYNKTKNPSNKFSRLIDSWLTGGYNNPSQIYSYWERNAMDDTSVVVNENTNEIKPKMQFSGTVKKITLAGAVIDIGLDMPCILHISQIVGGTEDQPIKRVEDVIQVGQTVDVWVRRVKEGRVELTMLKPLSLEWRDIEKGMVVKGKVTRLEKFGAFVEIGAERPGLIHISEMAHGYVRTPSEVVKEGDEIEAEVLEVNRRKKQIKLSMKALQEAPEVEETPKPAEASKKEKSPRRRKSGKGSKSDEGYEGGDVIVESSTPGESDPTFMEIALRAAMERANERKESAARSKKSKNISKEHEDIFTRTLGNKVKTS
jgi:small subunit ribosomal protein S1